MTVAIIAGKFPLGELRITPGITGVMTRDEAFDALIRHMTGDWGDLDKHDWKQNDIALERGFRLFSRYVTPAGTPFWIITKHDRSVTTIRLPEEN